MYDVFLDALADTIKMLPLLFIIYIGIGLIEYKWGHKIGEKVQKAGVVGPAVGAFVGGLPQCGFSVVTTALYTQRLVTIGTLLAVYLSTSDEAIPVILSQPGKAKIIFPLILTKIIIALIAGYGVDFVFRKTNKNSLEHIKAFKRGEDDKSHHHESVLDEQACCGHSASTSDRKFNTKEIFLHPMVHTVKVCIFIFVITFLINAAIFQLGENSFEKLFLGHSIFQPFIAAFIGLIPNCAASVAITELFLKGTLTYGSAIAGLCASGGLGLLVLVRTGKDKMEVLTIFGLLFGISVTVGLVIQYFS